MSQPDPQSRLSFCRNCAEAKLSAWKGWPHRDPVPVLCPLASEPCPDCGCTDTLDSSRIVWLNYHGPYSTGLPDYWLLVVSDVQSKWGRPYLRESQCPKCAARTIVSELKYPNGQRELKHNCTVCEVRSAT